MTQAADIIHYLSLLLPFANETAIVLTHSKLPIFKGLYELCIDDILLDGMNKKGFHDKVCNSNNYYNKMIIDLLAYFGIILFIGKNTLHYGYATGVATGMVLIFCSIMLPNMFLGITIEKIVKMLHVTNPYAYIAIGILLIIALIVITNFLETITQNLTKTIKIDPESEKGTKS
jgi:hypothetical protein